jgi:hypothetical protein
MNPPLYHVVYQSTATKEFTEPELLALLSQSRAWNTAHELTGVLLYSQGYILQVLEGSQQEVHSIFDRIQKDHRHLNVVKLADGPLAHRSFAEWSMGFLAIQPTNYERLAGYFNPLQTKHLATMPEQGKDSLHEVLTTFVRKEMLRL